MLNVGVVGFGYWGPNLVRNFNNNSQCTVSHICDASTHQLDKAEKLYPSVKTTTNFECLLTKEIDAIVIATPPESHCHLALAALNSGKHVFIEKPLCLTKADAKKIHDIARERNLKLMVDHTFLYTPAVQYIKKNFWTIGEPLNIDSIRINLGLFQNKTDVVFDLAVHDLSIICYLLDGFPDVIFCQASKGYENFNYDTAYITLKIKNTSVGIHVSWLSPIKIRKMLIVGTERMIEYNDLEPIYKINIHNTGIDVLTDPLSNQQLLTKYRIGDIFTPNIDSIEALSACTNEFTNAVLNNHPITSNSKFGCQIVSILEACQKSYLTEKAVEVQY